MSFQKKKNSLSCIHDESVVVSPSWIINIQQDSEEICNLSFYAFYKKQCNFVTEGSVTSICWNVVTVTDSWKKKKKSMFSDSFFLPWIFSDWVLWYSQISHHRDVRCALTVTTVKATSLRVKEGFLPCVSISCIVIVLICFVVFFALMVLWFGLVLLAVFFFFLVIILFIGLFRDQFEPLECWMGGILLDEGPRFEQ